MESADAPVPYRVGQWLPSDHAFLARWLEAMIHKTLNEPRPLHPVVADFRDVIESDPAIFMLFNQMFEQVPRRPPYDKDPTGKCQLRDYQHMLQLLNTLMTHAPEFDQTGLVGCPINTIFDWSMGTAAGMAAFLDERVNAELKKVLNAWGRFLCSSDSTYVLSDHPQKGWFGADARKAMPDFAREFRCDPDEPHYGFRSSDDFFTREFRAGVHMLANDTLAPLFAVASVYQAYLSPLSYHRWHSPVSGTIRKAYVLVFIEADNTDIGLMCVLAVGMAEVSSCQITVYEGQRVRKGDQIGMFHYGGSTHCLIFRPGVKLEFDHHGQKPGLHAANIPVNARVATVVR